jgi:hypothetical protein
MTSAINIFWISPRPASSVIGHSTESSCNAKFREQLSLHGLATMPSLTVDSIADGSPATRQLPFSKQHRAGQKPHCTRRQIAPVTTMLTLVANYLLWIESFVLDGDFNCETSGHRPAQPSRDALAECVNAQINRAVTSQLAAITCPSSRFYGKIGACVPLT